MSHHTSLYSCHDLGRAWDKTELRHKSFEELHQLWYLCVKDRNRIATQEAEMRHLKLRGTNKAAEQRDLTVSSKQGGRLGSIAADYI